MDHPTASSCEEVLAFWFVHPDKSIRDKTRFWFRGGPDVDMLIKKRLGDLLEQARSGGLEHWSNLSSGFAAGLAYIILIDQCSRNVYRGTAKMFTHDPKALNVALRMIKQYDHARIPWYQRLFLYMPLQHSENKDMQDLGLTLYAQYALDAEGTDVQKSAQISLKKMIEHHTVIRQFGRFPYRNAILGRRSTTGEIAALENWPYMWSLSKERYNLQLKMVTTERT